jgi:MoxR-like ATPase
VKALISVRFNLSIDDIRAVAPAVLRHRVILNFDAHADGQTPETVLAEVIKSASSHSSAAA